MVTSLMAVALVAAQPLTTNPVPDWQWDEDQDRCALTQNVDGSRASVRLARYAGSDSIAVEITDRPIADGILEPLPSTRVAVQPGLSFVGDGRTLVDRFSGARSTTAIVDGQAFLEALSRASTIELSHERIPAMRLPIRRPATAVRALLECEDARLRAWGIDLAYWRSLRVPPRPLTPLSQLFSEDDYPPGYLLNNVRGAVLIRLTVGADGLVRNCTHIRRADKYFLQRICGKLKRHARFQPALDQQGRPVAAPFVTSAYFRIES